MPRNSASNPANAFPSESTELLRRSLEALYRTWHRPLYLSTDPISLVHEFSGRADREIAAFVVSSLALGRVSAIQGACRKLFDRVGEPLFERLADPPASGWESVLDGLTYRFFPPRRLGSFLDAIARVLRRFGSIEAAFREASQESASMWDALDRFVALFRDRDSDWGILLPLPGRGSSFKRVNLFLRWMVRSDEIDLGLWTSIDPTRLLMPIDTHVLQWARGAGLTKKKQANRASCQEITDALRAVNPQDPLKYDFSITRAGMSKSNAFPSPRN